MDYTKSEFWIALAIGGSVCAAGNTLLQFTKKDDTRPGFNFRSVIRDFCIGAFLAATIFMFLPESITNILGGAAESVSVVSKGLTGGGSNSVSPMGDIELRVGPARF